MKVKRIDHVGIVVKDLDAALATYERNFDLQADPARGGEVTAFAIKNGFVPIGGTDLEFFSPTTEDGPVAKFVEERGEGLYMIPSKSMTSPPPSTTFAALARASATQSTASPSSP